MSNNATTVLIIAIVVGGLVLISLAHAWAGRGDASPHDEDDDR